MKQTVFREIINLAACEMLDREDRVTYAGKINETRKRLLIWFDVYCNRFMDLDPMDGHYFSHFMTLSRDKAHARNREEGQRILNMLFLVLSITRSREGSSNWSDLY